MGDTSDKILHELLSLSKESSERDTRIETKMDNVEQRITAVEKHSEKQDQQIEKLTTILSNQKALELTVTNHEKRIKALEDKPGIIALASWKKIGGIALSVVVTAIVTYLITQITK